MGSLDPMRRDLTRRAALAARNTASDWESRLRRESPTDTGDMRSRTNVVSRATARGAVIEAKVDTSYAHIVASGQRAHSIPVPGGSVKNPYGNLYNERTGFAAKAPVWHPGALPRSWWDDALRDVPDLLQRNWNGVR